MRKPRPMPSALVIAAFVAAIGVLHVLRPPTVLYAQARSHAAPNGFTAFLARVDTAQLELQNGRPAAFQALWAPAEDVTLSGGFGGTIEKGWPPVSSRLAWAGTRFTNGTNRIERLVTHVSGTLAYVIQAEHLRYRVPGETSESAREYRVTMIFRREAGEWPNRSSPRRRSGHPAVERDHFG